MAASPEPADPFDGIVRRLDYPMVVVTLAVDDERSGCLVGFTTQCSIDPRRYLVGLSEKNHTFRVAARGAERLAVHLLRADDRALSELFGEETGDDVDKFAHCRWQPGPDGVPILADAAAWFTGPVLDRFEVGDHTAFLVEVDLAHDGGASAFLQFQAVQDMDPGHEP